MVVVGILVIHHQNQSIIVLFMLALKWKLGIGKQKDQREEIEPLKVLDPAIRVSLYTEKIDPD